MDLIDNDTMIAAAIGCLAAIFVGSLIVLIVICRRNKKKKSWDRFDNDKRYSRKSKKRNEPELAYALSEIGLGNALEIINDQQWVCDASGLIPHCLSILRICHSLTERLATLAMRPTVLNNSTERLIEAAKRIPFRVDDVVQAMYPPLDARLLEARVAALVLAVGQLALLTQTVVGTNKSWIDQSLKDMDEQLLILRKTSIEIDEPKRPDFSRKIYV